MVAAAQVLNRVIPTASATQNEWSDRPLNDVICLFDVDGTLSLSRKVIISNQKEPILIFLIYISF